ncbi:O-methyltransferase [Paenibacillus dendritiformis]|uniref:O-methyltransferase n=1 Tax=Paenibacillus dendritiformis TaxID=130049 RepID=UPI0018CCCDBE|nr:O-methyltransferase [Paenibacillus dendritiformis]MBG9795817.1 O-methyltransferase [Paenibacillus dendritiformis]
MGSYGIPLARQLSMVFDKLESELLGLTGGTVIVCIRNDVIGKFGVKHDALESQNGVIKRRQGLLKRHVAEFRQTAMEVLKHKKQWTHGEIVFDFAMKQDTLLINTWFESNYNLIHMLEKPETRAYRRVS